MAERPNAAVLKTVNLQGFGGSNPPPSASMRGICCVAAWYVSGLRTNVRCPWHSSRALHLTLSCTRWFLMRGICQVGLRSRRNLLQSGTWFTVLCARQDLNLRPQASEACTLSAELRAPFFNHLKLTIRKLRLCGRADARNAKGFEGQRACRHSTR